MSYTLKTLFTLFLSLLTDIIVAAKSVKVTMPEHDALISEYSHLKGFPREKEALHALKKIASLVKPIMRARGWTVGTLAEFYPDSRNLLGTQGYPPKPDFPGAEADSHKELT